MARKPARRRVHHGTHKATDRMLTFEQSMARLTRLIEREEFDAAAEMVDSLWEQHRDHPDLIAAALVVAGQRDEQERAAELARRAIAARPDLPLYVSLGAVTHMRLGQDASALLYLRKLAERWPEHQVEDLDWREALAELEHAMPDMLQDWGLAGQAGVEAAADLERSQNLLPLREYDEALRLVESVVQRYPSSALARRQQALVRLHSGDPTAASEAAREGARLHPESVRAQADLVRYLCLSGAVTEASERARSLTARAEEVGSHGAVARALSHLSEDQRVLDTYRAVLQQGPDGPEYEDAVLHHLGAVAAWRLGLEDEANEAWDRAQDLDPDDEVIDENLADLENAEGDQDAPWPTPLIAWIGVRHAVELADKSEAMERANPQPGGEQAREFAEWVADMHPPIVALVPLLLERGDSTARLVAQLLAEERGRPELDTALRDHALSRWGPDISRLQAAAYARKRGLLEGPLRLWLRGGWRDIPELRWKIVEPPPPPEFPVETQRRTDQAHKAEVAGHKARAEALLRQLVAEYPDDAGFRIRLVAALGRQGKREQAVELLEQVLSERPEEVVARCQLSMLSVARGRLHEAEELLAPAVARPQLAMFEFASLVGAEYMLARARGDVASARSWVDLGRSVDPLEPVFDAYDADLLALERPAETWEDDEDDEEEEDEEHP